MRSLARASCAVALFASACAQGTVPSTDAGPLDAPAPPPDALPPDALDARTPDAPAPDVVTPDVAPTPDASDASGPARGHLGIGVFYQPSPTTDAAYADMARFGTDLVVAINTDGSEASGRAMLDAAAHNGLGLVVRDSRFGDAPPALDAVDAVVAAYGGRAGLAGYYVRDEPPGAQLPGYAPVWARLLARDPAHTANYLNLVPTYADDSRLFVPRDATEAQTMATDGTYVRPGTPLAQTFTTGSERFIDAIELNVDAMQWSSSEPLTLTLYDGASRVAGQTLRGSNNGNFPRFVLEAAVQPAHAYRWELVHGGGGDGSVGWVTRSSSDAYAGGVGSTGGTAGAYDYYFRVLAAADASEAAQRAGGAGDWVTPSRSLGETFTVPAGTTEPLRSIELWIDPSTWDPGEALALTVWDSPAKHTALGRAVLHGSNNGYYPRWDFDAHLAAGATYYLELTHEGGGDGSVGWVVFSTGDADPRAQGYEGGAPEPWDLAFRAFFGVGTYDAYVDAWAAQRPWQVAYDHYPFNASGDSATYFWNMALVRDRALAHGVSFWGYLQAIAWGGMRVPTASELRWNAFTTLASGAAGLYYFTYQDPVFDGVTHFHDALVNADGSHGALFAPATALNAEVHALGRALGGAHSDAVYWAGPSVASLPQGLASLPPGAPLAVVAPSSAWLVGLFTLADGRRAAMLVNLDHGAARTASLRFSPAPAHLGEVSHGDGSTVDLPAGAAGDVSLDVAAGDGRLLVW